MEYINGMYCKIIHVANDVMISGKQILSFFKVKKNNSTDRFFWFLKPLRLENMNKNDAIF